MGKYWLELTSLRANPEGVVGVFTSVLVPLDGSGLAECALPYARELVEKGCAGRIVFMNVVPGPEALGMVGFKEGLGGALDYSADIQAKSIEYAAEYLASIESQFKSEGMDVSSAVLTGPTATTIAEYAKHIGADLILLATHGYTGIKRLMIGSVAQRVLNEAECPVLLVRS